MTLGPSGIINQLFDALGGANRHFDVARVRIADLSGIAVAVKTLAVQPRRREREGTRPSSLRAR